MSKTVLELTKEGDDFTLEIEGNYLDVVSALSLALVKVAKIKPNGKEVVTSACSIIIDEIND